MWMNRVKVWFPALVLRLAVTGEGLGAFAGRQAEEPAQPKKVDPAPKVVGRVDQLTQLVEARIAAAENAYRGCWQAYEAGIGREETVHLSSRRWLVAQVELSDQKTDREAVLAAYLDRLRQTDEVARAKLSAGILPESAEYVRKIDANTTNQKVETSQESFESTWKAYEKSEVNEEHVYLASLRLRPIKDAYEYFPLPGITFRTPPSGFTTSPAWRGIRCT